MSRLRRCTAGQDGERGLTLVEILIAGSLFMVLNLFTFTAVLGNSRVTTTAREATDVNQEARLLLNRMSRELREAKAITDVVSPVPSGHATSYAIFDPEADRKVTFDIDFNAVNGIEANADDPETITYFYERAAKRVLLQAGGQSLPVLAANVTDFRMTFLSQRFEVDGSVDGVKDNVVTWEELDADPTRTYGNGNRVLDVERVHVDSVAIEVTLFHGERRQTYRTQVDLRNRTS